MNSSSSTSMSGNGSGTNSTESTSFSSSSSSSLSLSTTSSTNASINLPEALIGTSSSYDRTAFMLREAMILNNFKHGHLLPVLGLFCGKGKERLGRYFMLTPFIENDLDYYISQGQQVGLQKGGTVKTIMFQLVLVMCFLHSAGVVHRDIDPTSIMICQTGTNQIWLSSFNFARSIAGNEKVGLDSLPAECAGFACFRAPELLLSHGFLHKNFTEKHWKACDVWSVGCVFAWLLRNGRPLFNGNNPESLLTSILEIEEIRDSMGTMSDEFNMLNDHPCHDKKTLKEEVQGTRWDPNGNKILINVDKSVRSKNNKSSSSRSSTMMSSVTNEELDLLERMLKLDRNNRITFFEALCHPYFSKPTKFRKTLKEKLNTWNYFGEKNSFSEEDVQQFAKSYCSGLLQ